MKPCAMGKRLAHENLREGIMKSWTYELAMAAGKDAANAQMRKAGRKRWNVADWNLMVAIFERLFPHVGVTA